MSNLRVLQVLPSLEMGGVERGTVDIAKAIAASGGQAFVASSGGRLVIELERHRIQHITLPLASKNPWRIWRNARHLANIIRQYDINLVHARSRAPAWSAYWATQRTHVPFVTTYHAAYSTQYALKRWYNSVMTRGVHVIAISEYIRDHIFRIYPEVADRVSLIYRGIDCELFDPKHVNPNRIAALSQQWRLPDGVPIIMLPARLSPKKGHGALLKILANLTDLEWFCIFVGTGPEHDHLTYLITQAGLSQRVRLVGACSDMPSAYMLADVVVHPSSWPEGFGRTVAEAQCMGRPVVATSSGAITEILRHGSTGWVVPMLDNQVDIELFSTYIREALQLSAEDRQTLATTARRRIVRQFNNKLMCERTLEIYNSLLEKRAPADALTGAEQVPGLESSYSQK